MPPSTLHPDEITTARFIATTLDDCLALDHPRLRVPAIASKLQVRSERLHKWLNPDDVIHNLPLHMLFQWHAALGPTLFYRVADRLQYDLVSRIQPTSKQDALTLVLGLLPQLGHTLLAVAPYLEGHCPHAQQRELKQATLGLTTSLHSLDRWAQAA